DTTGDAVLHAYLDPILMDTNGDRQMVIAADIFESVLHEGEEEERVDLLTVEIVVETGFQPQFFRGTGLRQLDEVFEVVDLLAYRYGPALLVELVAEQFRKFLHA